jgi:hypothetical protein
VPGLVGAALVAFLLLLAFAPKLGALAAVWLKVDLLAFGGGSRVDVLWAVVGCGVVGLVL